MDEIRSIKVSIIIVTYNRPDDLKETLQTVLEQTNPIHEIIIVDDSSDDSTKQICEEFRSIFPALIWHLNTGTHSIPDARNEGIELATGDIICFIDDDVTLQNDYLEKILEVFKNHPNALGITGYDMNLKPHTKNMNTLFRMMANMHFRKDQAFVLPSMRIVYPFPLTKVIPCQCLIGHNMAYRREAFTKFSFTPAPYDHFAMHDDIEFAYRLQKDYPGTLFVTPYAKLEHRVSPFSRNTTLKILKNHQWHEWKFFKKLVDKTPFNVTYFFYSRISNFILDAYFLIKGQTAHPNKPIFLYFKEILIKNSV